MLASAPVVKADVCDEISALGDRWHALSKYIDDHSDDGKLRKNEIRKVSAETRVLVPPTKVLGTRLVENFKGKDETRVRAWGKQILAALEELGTLTEEDDWDEDVKIIDRLVEIIDKVSEVCK